MNGESCCTEILVHFHNHSYLSELSPRAQPAGHIGTYRKEFKMCTKEMWYLVTYTVLLLFVCLVTIEIEEVR
jgi:hypothetical protein